MEEEDEAEEVHRRIGERKTIIGLRQKMLSNS